MQQEDTIDFKHLVKKWVDKKIEKYNEGTSLVERNLKCDFVDLAYENDDKEVKKRYREIPVSEKFQGKSEIIRAKSNDADILKSENRGQLVFCEAVRVGGVVETQITEKQTITNESTFSVKFNQAFHAGITLGASYYVDLGIDIGVDFSQETQKTGKKTESRELEHQTIFEKDNIYGIQTKIYENNISENITRQITLKGKIPIKFNKKVRYPESNLEEHQLQFIPVVDIIADLKNLGELPRDCQFDIDAKKVTISSPGEYQIKVKSTDRFYVLLDSEGKVIEATEDKKVAKAVDKKGVSQTKSINEFKAEAGTDITAQQNSVVNVSGANAAHTGIAVEPADMKDIPKDMYDLMKASIEQAGEYNQVETNAARNLNAGPSSKIDATNAKARVVDFDFRRQPVVPSVFVPTTGQQQPAADQKTSLTDTADTTASNFTKSS